MKGYIATCADRRFHRQQHEEFQRLTGLKPTDYWIEAKAGGAPAMASSTTADYAYEHGAVADFDFHMGWGAHGSNCGGRPGKSDEEIEAMLDKKISQMKKRYPKAKHYKLFSKE